MNSSGGNRDFQVSESFYRYAKISRDTKRIYKNYRTKTSRSQTAIESFGYKTC